MKVTLLNYTSNPVQNVVVAAKLCYSNKDVEDIEYDVVADGDDKGAEFLKRLHMAGHLSPFEHASFTFAIEDVSRVTTHQLVRHRLASYSQRSQRYASQADRCVIPERVKQSTLYAEVLAHISDALQLHHDLVEEGVPKEDARYILPSGMESSIIVTMNARELIHFYQLRSAPEAQWEIRHVAREMMDQAMNVAEDLFIFVEEGL
jgi:thymidylate synthase (FAD)